MAHAATSMHHMLTQPVQRTDGHVVQGRTVKNLPTQQIGRDHVRIPRGIDGSIDRGCLPRGTRILSRFVIFFVSTLASAKDADFRLPERGVDIADKTTGIVVPL